MSDFNIKNTGFNCEPLNYDTYLIDVTRILSTIGKKIVDGEGTSMYPEVRFKSQDRWEIEDYISDAYTLIERAFGKYAVITTKIIEISDNGIKYKTSDLEIKCPSWVSDDNMKEVYHLIDFFVIRYIVARKIEHLSPKENEKFMESAKLYLDEAKKTFYIKSAPKFPVVNGDDTLEEIN